MTIPSNTRIVTFALLLAASFSTIELSADERQPLFRYLGVGWGAGYHSYNPRSAVNAAHGFCCTDRYSRPANFGCIDCGQSAGGVNYQSHGNQGYGNGSNYGHGSYYGAPTRQMAPQPAPQKQMPSQRASPAAETLPSPNNGSLPNLQNPPTNSSLRLHPSGVTSYSPQRYVPAPPRQQLQNQFPAQPRYRSAGQMPYPQNQRVATANYNRAQSQNRINYPVYRPQYYSSNPMQYRLNTNQQRLQQAFRPAVEPSNVYRGIR